MPAKIKLSLSVQYPDARLKQQITRPMLRRWVNHALLAPAELTIRFVASAEGQTLNREYRGKDYATNVLTFAYSADALSADEDPEAPTQADLVLCTDVLLQEAAQQQKSVLEHTAHLVVHGVLHAQGYDHQNDVDAAEMEQLETGILARLGFSDPYQVR
ncbi:MAG: rRNA maturation RNase YbeY [Herbaspirillum sp.]